MKYHLKKDGVVRFTKDENNFDDILNKGEFWTEGYYTESQVIEMGLSIKGRESRVVIDFPKTTYIVSIGEDVSGQSNFKSQEDFEKYCLDNGYEFGRKLFEYETEEKPFYTVPEKTHIEYFVEKNYTIEVEDETLTQEYKDAQKQKAYIAAGCTTDAMIVALWEKEVENRPQAVDAIQAKRLIVKQGHPKN